MLNTHFTAKVGDQIELPTGNSTTNKVAFIKVSVPGNSAYVFIRADDEIWGKTLALLEPNDTIFVQGTIHQTGIRPPSPVSGQPAPLQEWVIPDTIEVLSPVARAKKMVRVFQDYNDRHEKTAKTAEMYKRYYEDGQKRMQQYSQENAALKQQVRDLSNSVANNPVLNTLRLEVAEKQRRIEELERELQYQKIIAAALGS